MKLNTQQLRQIIQEEISRLHEAEAKLGELTPTEVEMIGEKLGQLLQHTSEALRIMDGMAFWADRKKPVLQPVRDALWTAHSTAKELQEKIHPPDFSQDEPDGF